MTMSNLPQTETTGYLAVSVGSCNPVKALAAENAFTEYLTTTTWSHTTPDNTPIDTVKVFRYNAASQVPDQPIGEEQTKLGATNRAIAAFQAYKDEHNCEPDFAVGMEGGISTTEEGKDIEFII